MQRQFWEERWRAGQIAFHRTDPNPHLVRHAERLGAPGGRVLVPLCGKSVDLAWLAAAGHEAWGIEIVPEAAEAFFTERQLEPQRLRVAGLPALRFQTVTILVADLFDPELTGAGRFGAIWDRAALVAIDPPQRRAYLERLRLIAAPEARLLLVTMEHDKPGGPPFSISEAEVTASCEGLFTSRPIDVIDVLDEEPRFRERGATFLRERVWAGGAL